MNIIDIISKELNVKASQVEVAIQLLDDGSTVPFISRYRKEATGGLDDGQLRLLEERLSYLRELESRRQTILKSIKEQEKLTPELEKKILQVDNKSTLEDLYLPYKPKRRTKAQIAKEAGLEPLAKSLLENPDLIPEDEAKKYINTEFKIESELDALDGAKHILMEAFAEEAELITFFRNYLWQNAILKSEVSKDKQEEGIKYKDYYDYSEAIKSIPSHRALALLRGQREAILHLNMLIDEEQKAFCLNYVSSFVGIRNSNKPADSWLAKVVNDTWRIKIFLKLEVELMMRLREEADEEAIKVFALNLKHLLMASPAGSHVTMGLDPGLRTGVKVVVVDATGKLLAFTTLFPHAPKNHWDQALHELARLCKEHQVSLISIGNGTASRETDKLAKELIKKYPDLNVQSLVVSEAGASVYSASEVAAKEFPDLDVTYRGAVSIARRLQDPLAELVKIDPKSIGVGQYQHDVNQVKLSRMLDNVMEDCVNAVGVNVNTASAPLLTCVAGLNRQIANNIINHRDQHGPFKRRVDLMAVSRMGEVAYEQSAGFLRIINGDDPLDASAVHPEAYPLVEEILKSKQKSIKEMIGNVSLLRQIQPAQYVNDKFGLPTVQDVLAELEKPGRDPRPEFKTAEFKEGVDSLSDLKQGMLLEGVVTNVANFGAFVDVGVHQDGLVHISMLADRFVKDPSEVVKVGDIVKVKVVEVDIPRKRIALSMRMGEESPGKAPKAQEQARTSRATPKAKHEKHQAKSSSSSSGMESAMGNAFKDALMKGKR